MRGPWRATFLSFLTGAAAAGATLVLFLSALLFVGLIPRLPLLVLAAGPVGAGFAAWAGTGGTAKVSSLPGGPFRFGAATLAVALVVGDSLASNTSPGWVVWLGSGSVVAVAAVGPSLVSIRLGSFPFWLKLLAAAAVIFALVRTVIGAGELGHDEAAYALKARSWLDATPATGWDIHRGIGQSVIAAAVLVFDQGAAGLRAVSLLLSVATIGAVWYLGKTLRSDAVGWLAAAIFAVAPSFLRRGAEFLSDVPSTGFLLVVAALLWRWATSDYRRNALLYWVAGLGAIAFYIRYQAVLSLGLLAVATALAFPSRVRSMWRALVGATVFFLALLVPHFVYATAVTGAPWGVVANTGTAGGRDFLGEGLVDYVQDLPDLLAGTLGGLAIVVGLAWITRSLFRGGESRSLAIYLAVAALGQMLALGLLSHGEPRFVFFPVALLLVAAALAADDWGPMLSAGTFRGAAVFVLASLVVFLALNSTRVDRNAEARGDSYEALATAARFAAAESGGGCGILTGSLPQITWYSGCETNGYDRRTFAIDLEPDLDRFLLFSEGGPRQPEGALLEDYLESATGPVLIVPGSGSTGDVTLYRVGE